MDKRYRVTTPTAGHNGPVAGITFTSGVYVGPLPMFALAYFQGPNGFQVTTADRVPLTELRKMTVAQLETHARELGIDLGGASKKTDIASLIDAAEHDYWG